MRSLKKMGLLLMAVLMSISIAQTTALASGKANADDKGVQTKEKVQASPQFVAVEAGEYYSAGLRNDGSVWVWGRNLYGELGLQEKVTYAYSNGPVRLSGLSDVKSISITTGLYPATNLAVKADGTVWQWGAGADRSKSTDNSIYSILPEQLTGITSATAAVSNGQYVYFIKKDGTVWSSKRNAAKPAITQVKGLSQIAQIEPHPTGIYAVKKDGSVWLWKEAAASAPVKIKGLSNIREISYAFNHGRYVALDKQGKAWAPNEKGKITKLQPQLTLQQVRAESGYTLMLTTSGEVYTYGRTVTGKQGKVNSFAKVTALGAGSYHNLFITDEGIVWGMGANKFMELGAPAPTPEGMAYAPIQSRPDIDVKINGKLQALAFPLVPTELTVQVPIRSLAAALQATYTPPVANQPDPVHTLEYNGHKVAFRAGSNVLETGDEQVALPEPVSSYQGATTVPIQMLEELGLKISWDAKMRVISIQDASGTNN